MHNRSYDPLVGACVRDFMNNVSHFQKESHGVQSYVGSE